LRTLYTLREKQHPYHHQIIFIQHQREEKEREQRERERESGEREERREKKQRKELFS